MKTLIIILIIISFLQTTIIPLDLVLIILICRAYLKTESSNLYLAFGFGLLVSFLEIEILGLNSIIYLISIQLTQAFIKSPLAGRSLLIVPISFVCLSLQTLQLSPKVILESILSLPILYIIRLWEERFIAKKEIRLKI